jgi:hypothetical protein
MKMKNFNHKFTRKISTKKSSMDFLLQDKKIFSPAM